MTKKQSDKKKKKLADLKDKIRTKDTYFNAYV